MPFPTFNSLQSFTPDQQREMEQFVSYLTGYHGIEHKDDGAHGAITADSVTERGRSKPMGEWIVPRFQAANFAGYSTLTWTVASADVITFQYTLIGTTMTVAFWLETTSTGGAATSRLDITIPDGYTARRAILNACHAKDNGTYTDAICYVAVGGSVISIERSDRGNWSAASANNTIVWGQISFEVET